MPVIHVFTPDDGDTAALLRSIADSTERALDLAVGDVVATHVPVGSTVLSGEPGTGG